MAPTTWLRTTSFWPIHTVVRKVPTPIRKVLSDLSNEERVFVGPDRRLQLR